MKRSLLTALLLVISSCTQQPPERSPLPDVEEVLPEPIGCQLSIGEPRGAEVLSVAADSPAETVLAAGDVIISLQGTPILDADDLVATVGDHQTGDQVEVVYEREGESESVTVVLESQPTDETRAYLGVTIRSDYDTISPEAADTLVEPGPTARSIEIAGSIYLFDPVELVWQATGIEIPEGMEWMSTTTGFYGATIEDPAVIYDLVTNEEVAHDGYRGWEPRQLIGSLGDVLLVMGTSDIAAQPGFVNVAIAGFDPIAGSTLWVSPVIEGFGVPVAAHGSPDSGLFVAVGTDQESGVEIGVEIFGSNGTLRSGGDELIDLGIPIGWFDRHVVGFYSDGEIISLLDTSNGSLSTLTVSPGLAETRLAAVGDGRHVLTIQGRDLLLDDLTDEEEVQVLADDCALGMLGTPGWGT